MMIAVFNTANSRFVTIRSFTMLLLLVCLPGCTCVAQDSINNKIVTLGNMEVTVQTSCYKTCENPVTFINLHDDENTAIEAAENFLQSFGGTLLQLKHTDVRLIYFKIESDVHGFDPNRIFTKTGIVTSLKKLGRYNATAVRTVTRLADTITSTFVPKPKLLVALHNNTDNKFSIRSYKLAKELKSNARKIFINPDMDPDDFVLTTELRVYKHLVERKINVVLQNNRTAIDEGSLSVYAARKGIPYINVEAQIGHLEEQIRMLNELKEIFEWYTNREPD